LLFFARNPPSKKVKEILAETPVKHEMIEETKHQFASCYPKFKATLADPQHSALKNKI